MTIDMIVPLEVGIACRDLPKLRAFYQDVMGFQFVSEIVVPAAKAAPSALSADGYTVVRLQTPYGERVKLLAPNTPSAPAAAMPGKYILDRAGASYLTFIVGDIDAAIAILLQAGSRFLTGVERVEARPGVYLAFCEDPEGNVLELVEYTDIEAYRPDLKKGSN
ncbi:bleomycin resistance protein [Herbaspirillum hiltneri N3]|uniref:Bleomycin resistance protein n=1 Tax=Herbaspirillum hiltneri N3 TaxID=1262470 RepID=A0ABM5UXM2_9BURK|nr:VOC family protein [Herbaspirillum hiltneri]AKZ61941.1 bleomycin resistance protein [Herbaspirillum hiltneri N3]